MAILRLVLRNALRHKLRTALTAGGIGAALLAFGLLRTVISAWYAGVDQAAPDRLVTRSRISITFTLPVSQKEKIEKVPGVLGVTHGCWFGGVYKDPKEFFAQIALENAETFDFFPEYIVDPEALRAFAAERNAAIVGETLVSRFGWKIGDVVRLKGTIYPGDWDFVIRGIYRGRDEETDTGQFFFNYQYIDQRMREDAPVRAGQIGWWVIKIDDPSRAAAISKAVDDLFRNSADETLTETEAAFAQSFVAMAGTIILALQVISFLVVGIILLVAANTMAMTVRERTSEHAVLRTLGFGPGRLIGLIAGESLMIAALGGVVGILLMFPVLSAVGSALRSWFPAFPITVRTFAMAGAAAFMVGALAAVFPVWRALSLPIASGLRRVD
jgi:putative ABC transport system permease protein